MFIIFFFNFLQLLYSELGNTLGPKASHYYCVPTTPPEKKISMAIWFLANMEVFRSIANLYGFENKGSAHKCIMEVLESICNILLDKYIRGSFTKHFILI
jgi:hypothetical protein